MNTARAVGGEPGITTPNLRGSYVQLQVPSPMDYPQLRELETSSPNLVLYRHRGVTPAPETYAATLWQGVSAQFTIRSVETDALVGLIALYGADYRNGFAYIASIVEPQYRQTGWPLEAFLLFFGYVFDVFPFRKLYAQTLEFNLREFASIATALFVEEARLGQHEYLAGRYWDSVTLALYRETWQTSRFSTRRSELAAALAMASRRREVVSSGVEGE